MKEIIEEYGSAAVGVLIGSVTLFIIGVILYQFLIEYINHFTTVLYG